MTTRFIRSILLSSIFSLFLFETMASHTAGADITWECLGNNQYAVKVKLYRDCSGINAPGSVNVDITGCATSQINLPLQNQGGTEVSQLCTSMIDSSTCNNGILTGYKRYDYEGIVTLAPCPLWRFSYALNARTWTNNLATQTTMYIDAELNSQLDPCNSSPRFTAQEVPYVCVNQKSAVDYSVEEDECDSLYFSMMSARMAQASNNSYNAPYSPTNPIEAGFNLDPYTGRMTFIPNQVGKFIVVLKCEEFDRATQQLKGYVTKETTFVADICDNNLPSDSSGYITNFQTNGGQLIDLYEFTVCQGADVSFDFCIYDPDLADTVSLTSNVTTALPGATFNYTPGNPACGTITWTATQGTCPTKAFGIAADDNHCALTGLNNFAYFVTVLPTTYAGDDQTICKGDSALLEVFGGSQFNWTAITGDTINVGVNFSCDTCSSAWASPDSTTTYVITTDVVGFCANIDTITITVVDTPQTAVSITGPTTVTALSTETYSVPFEAGITFDWTVSSGTIVSGQGSNTVDVIWDTSGVTQICVTKTVGATNCTSGEFCMDINVVINGVDEYGASNHFTIYPNPTNGVFSVDGTWMTDDVIQVFDLFGREVPSSITHHTSSIELDIRSSSAGVYFVQVGEAVRKLVKQ